MAKEGDADEDGKEKENATVQLGRSLLDAATQTPVKMGRVVTSMGKDSWKDWENKGRATFCPPASDLGRPVFHPDAEEAEVRLRQLKQEVRRAEDERDLAKAHLVRAEKEIKRRDHRLFKELEEHQNASILPERLSALVKECLKSGQGEELQLLRKKLTVLEASVSRARTGSVIGAIGASNTSAGGAPSTPRAQLAGRFSENDAPSSPLKRQTSFRKEKSLVAGGGGSAGGGGGGGGEALQTARAELERLQKLCAAHEVIREGLEKRVAQLEAQLQRYTSPPAAALSAPGAAAAAVGDKQESSASLFTEDGHRFDNYIRRLAGLSELPKPSLTAGGDQEGVRVRTDPKAKKRRDLQVGEAGGGEHEVVYEVTCQTSDFAGAGTTSNCYITFRGQRGEFGPCPLERAEAHAAREGVGVLEQDALDVFDVVALNVEELLEPLHSIVLSCDGTGGQPSWHLRTVSVRRHRSSSSPPHTYRFEWNDWVGAPQGAERISSTAASTRQPASVTILAVMTSMPALQSAAAAAAGPGADPHARAGKRQEQLLPTGAGAASAGGGRGGAGGGGRTGVSKAALAEACQSIVCAIRELHQPSARALAEHAGLQSIGRLLGAGAGAGGGGADGGLTRTRVELPRSCRNLCVLLLGPRQVCSAVAAWYAGVDNIADTGLSSGSRFTLVKLKPQQPAAPSSSHPPPSEVAWADRTDASDAHLRLSLAQVPGLLSSLAVSELACSGSGAASARMAQVDLLVPPFMDGWGVGGEGGEYGAETALDVATRQALEEIAKAVAELRESPMVTFKAWDKDGDGSVDFAEWRQALEQMGLDMPAARAQRLFQALDCSNDGKIQYGEFCEWLKRREARYSYALEKAVEAAAGAADLILLFLDPTTIHYKAGELAMIREVHAKFAGKMRVACYIPDSVRSKTNLRSHVLAATRERVEQAMRVASNSLAGHLPNMWLPSPNTPTAAHVSAVVDNEIDEILAWIMHALVSLEGLAVDETEHNIRVLLDKLWAAGDAGAGASRLLTHWLTAWREASSHRKTPSFVRLHSVIDKACKDAKRGKVQEEDVEAWTPTRVAQWLLTINPAFKQYEASFLDEQVTGQRLVRLTEEALKKKLNITSLGHRKEMLRHLEALLRARKAFLKH